MSAISLGLGSEFCLLGFFLNQEKPLRFEPGMNQIKNKVNRISPCFRSWKIFRKLKRAIRLHSGDSIYSLHLVNGTQDWLDLLLQLGQMQLLVLVLYVAGAKSELCQSH